MLYVFAAFCGPHAITLKQRDGNPVSAPSLQPPNNWLTDSNGQRGGNNRSEIEEGENLG